MLDSSRTINIRGRECAVRPCHRLPAGAAAPFRSARLHKTPVRARTQIQPLAAVPSEADVVVVGAGLAGLNCARILRQKGLNAIVLEAGDGVGGRVRTDNLDGFLLDRGFQIFLTGYPEAQATLDYSALQLQPFYAGAKVWWDGSFHTVADPLRHFVDGLLSLTNPIGSVGDKVNVGIFRIKSLIGSLDAVFSQPETTIEQRLKVREEMLLQQLQG